MTTTSARPPEKLEESYVYLSEPAFADGVGLMELWRSKQTQGGFVMGRDIPSPAIDRFLRGIMILEPLPGRGDYHVRLAGRAWLRRRAGGNAALRLSHIFGPDFFKSRLELTNRVLESGEPLIFDVVEYQSGLVRSRRETIVLRILAADGRTPWVLVHTAYCDEL